MVSPALQISALLLSLLGLLFLLITTVSNEWKSYNMETWSYEGLWMYCTETSLGVVQCKEFYPLLIVAILTQGLSSVSCGDVNVMPPFIEIIAICRLLKFCQCSAPCSKAHVYHRFITWTGVSTLFITVFVYRLSHRLKITGFVFTLGGWVIVGATLSNSYWKVSTVYGNVITTSSLYENLWQSCAEESTGISNCKAFTTLLALPAYIQACRALMILSLILGMCGTLLTLLGLRCTQLGNSSAATKTKMAMIGGMIFIVAGLSSMVAISWYAAKITAEFFDSLYGGTKYEFGYALYLGWAGSVLSILGGIFLACSCTRKHRDYKYAAAQKASEPYTCIKQSKAVTPAKDYV